MKIVYSEASFSVGTPRSVKDFLEQRLERGTLSYPFSVVYRDLNVKINNEKNCREFLERLNKNLEKLQLDYIVNQVDDYKPNSNINLVYIREKVEEGIHFLVKTQATVKLFINYADIPGVDCKHKGFSSHRDCWDEEYKKLIINVYTDNKHTMLVGRKMRFTLTDIPDKITIMDMKGNITTKAALGITKKEKKPYVAPPVKDIYLDKILRLDYKERV